MPQAVPLIVGSYATQAAVAFGAKALMASLIGAIVSLGTSRLLGLDKPGKLEDPGIKANVVGTEEPIPVVYGVRRVPGALVQIVVTGDVATRVPLSGSSAAFKRRRQPVITSTNTNLNVVLCWCEGQIDAITDVLFSEVESTDAKFAGFFTRVDRLGAAGQPAISQFVTELDRTFTAEARDKLWSVNHRMNDTAYSYFRLNYNATAWDAGIPQITARVRGKLCADPRTAFTITTAPPPDGEVGVPYYYVFAATGADPAYTQNPASCIYDYLTTARYGVGLNPADIDIPSFQEAANYFDQIVNVNEQNNLGDTVSVPGLRYECNAAFYGSDVTDNLNQLLASCNSALVFSGGKYRLRPYRPEAPVFALTPDNIVGGFAISLESSQTRFNRLLVSFTNAGLAYQRDTVILDDAGFREADGGKLLETEVALDAVTSRRHATVIGRQILAASRYSISVELTALPSAVQCEVMDVVTVTHDVPGWDAVEFRVMAMQLKPDGLVSLQLQQHAAAIYDLPDLPFVDSPPTSYLPDPTIMPEVYIQIIDVVERTDPATRVTTFDHLVGIKDDNLPYITAYEISYRQSLSDEWSVRFVPRQTPTLLIPGLPIIPSFMGQAVNLIGLDGVKQLWIRSRGINSLGVASPYVDFGPYFPPGVLTPPGIVNNQRSIGHPNGCLLRWDADPAQPLQRTEIRRAGFLSGIFHPDDAEVVAIVPGSSYLDPVPETVSAATVYLYWMRHISRFNVVGFFLPPIAGRSGLREYADDAAAGAAGLERNDMYKTATGEVRIKL